MSEGRPFTHLGRLSRALLARGAGKVRGTDWWAVFVEMAVVVLGILIAFELNEWDQRRQARAEERLVLAHVEEEAAADLQAVQSVTRIHRRGQANAHRLARILAGPPGAADEEAYNRNENDPCNLGRLPAVRRAGAERGIGMDRLAAISDDQLRILLRKAAAERVFADSQLDYFRLTFVRYNELLGPYEAFGRPAESDYQCVMDIAGMRADGRFPRVLPAIARNQLAMSRFRQSEVTATRAVLDRVRCLRAGTCRNR